VLAVSICKDQPLDARDESIECVSVRTFTARRARIILRPIATARVVPEVHQGRANDQDDHPTVLADLVSTFPLLAADLLHARFVANACHDALERGSAEQRCSTAGRNRFEPPRAAWRERKC
jgi:hypothetical protein